MASSKIPFNITYKKPGTVPPLFLAGSFSDPQWQPKEMDCSMHNDGERIFHSEIMVEPGKDYQFKLRIGQGDWWVLSEDYPVATDDSGNNNNVLNVTNPRGDKPDNHDTNDDLVAKADAEKPILAASINIPPTDNTKDKGDELKTPLFAHECLGAYEVAEDESEEEACPSIPVKHGVKLRTDNTAVDSIDLNDPTLEKFPSDRNSILDALRTIQTHLNEDHTHLDEKQASPRVASSGRSGIDTAEDSSHLKPSLSPGSMRKLSYSGFGRSRSAVSLGSIAEEPKLDELGPEQASAGEMSPDIKEPETPPVITMPNPNTLSAFEEPRSPPSEEDEAVVMKNPEFISREKSGIVAPTHPDINTTALRKQARGDGPAIKVGSTGVEEDSHFELDKPKNHPRASRFTELYDDKLDDSSNSIPEESTRPRVSMVKSHVDVIHGQDTTHKWLHGLLSNKLPILLTTGALAIAVGISLMSNKPDN